MKIAGLQPCAYKKVNRRRFLPAGRNHQTTRRTRRPVAKPSSPRPCRTWNDVESSGPTGLSGVFIPPLSPILFLHRLHRIASEIREGALQYPGWQGSSGRGSSPLEIGETDVSNGPDSGHSRNPNTHALEGNFVPLCDMRAGRKSTQGDHPKMAAIACDLNRSKQHTG